MEQQLLFRKFLLFLCAIGMTSGKAISPLDVHGLTSSAGIHSVLKRSTLVIKDEILRNRRSESCTEADKSKAIDQINNCTQIACEHSFFYYRL